MPEPGLEEWKGSGWLECQRQRGGGGGGGFDRATDRCQCPGVSVEDGATDHTPTNDQAVYCLLSPHVEPSPADSL